MTSPTGSPTGSAFVLLGGTVFTADRDRTTADAVAVSGNRIVAVGSARDVTARLPDAPTVELDGRTVLPGLIDAHNHFLATGETLASLDVRYPGVSSVEALVGAVAEEARRAPPGTWVVATGFDHAKYEREPTRWDLDEATTEHPVFVLHVSGHQGIANSAALAERGITDATPDPDGGHLVRDERGRPTGLCVETALGLLQPVELEIGHHGPNFHASRPLGELVDAVDRAGRAFLAAGITTVCDAQVTRRELVAYQEARRLGRLAVRTVCMPLSHQLAELETVGLRSGFGDDHLRLGAVKFYADGSLIGGTAAFSEPFGRSGEFVGSMYWEPDAFTDAVVRAHRAGWQVGVHAQGDRAIELALDSFAAALAARPEADPRFRIEHAGYPTAEQVVRMAELGVITVNQPSYLVDSGDEFVVRLGPRANRLQPLRDELDAGVRMVLSSDSDVASYRPMDTISAAVRRRTASGSPIGADQALTIEEALLAHTIEAAVALGMEHRIGSIEPGKLADLTVLDGDLFTTADDALAELPTWMTVLDGVVVHGPQPQGTLETQ